MCNGNVISTDGIDKSWFHQKGAVKFSDVSTSQWYLECNLSGPNSAVGDEYADLSMAEQCMQENWLFMIGACPRDYEPSGYKDCKVSGCHFLLLQLNYRRTHWHVLCCPHDGIIIGSDGNEYTSDPHRMDHFQIPAHKGLQFERMDAGRYVLRDRNGSAQCECRWPDMETKDRETLYAPMVLVSNTPTRLHVTTGSGNIPCV
eukprot:GEMP01072265.1.p1 GENE.GEMP01072265.1~~GEMP01072265.1.p1  ORF type:complete len:202 (+),score=28.60 GEMP01072265.1:195-800(+)